jgi:hypothetical protein
MMINRCGSSPWFRRGSPNTGISSRWRACAATAPHMGHELRDATLAHFRGLRLSCLPWLVRLSALRTRRAMSEIDSGGIFVSYRRQDTRHAAGRLFDRLAERFGRTHAFMDVVSIEPGLDFRKAIDKAISRCDVLLAPINPLLEAHECGFRNLDNYQRCIMAHIAVTRPRGQAA